MGLWNTLQIRGQEEDNAPEVLVASTNQLINTINVVSLRSLRNKENTPITMTLRPGHYDRQLVMVGQRNQLNTSKGILHTEL